MYNVQWVTFITQIRHKWRVWHLS